MGVLENEGNACFLFNSCEELDYRVSLENFEGSDLLFEDGAWLIIEIYYLFDLDCGAGLGIVSGD